jgi:hypothetical protein
MGCCCGSEKKVIKKGNERIISETSRSKILIQKNFGNPKNEVDRKRKLAILKKQGKIK